MLEYIMTVQVLDFSLIFNILISIDQQQQQQQVRSQTVPVNRNPNFLTFLSSITHLDFTWNKTEQENLGEGGGEWERSMFL